MLALRPDRVLWGENLAAQSGAVLVEGDRIAGLASPDQIPSNATVVALESMTIVPGLIDCHVHLTGWRSQDPHQHVFDPIALRAARATADLSALLRAGFTTVRDCGSPLALALKPGIAEGSIEGPDLLAVGEFVERTAGADDPSGMPLDWARAASPNGNRLADGPWQVRQAVREQVRGGADWIKTCSTGAEGNSYSDPRQLEWTDEELEALVRESHRLGRRVAVHAHYPEGIRQALSAGADSIEHGTYIDEWTADEMAKAGVPLIPTLTTRNLLVERGHEIGASQWRIDRARGGLASQAAAVQIAKAHGVTLAMGSDTEGQVGQRHGENARELSYMVAAGLSPLEALVSATRDAARALGIGDRAGVLDEGRIAHVVGVVGDPSNDVEALSRVAFVAKAGVVVVGPPATT